MWHKPTINMKTETLRDKHITMRLPQDLYQSYVDAALEKGQKEKRIVNLSEVLRDALVKYVKK